MNICQKCHTLNSEFVAECRHCGAALMPPLVLDHFKLDVATLLEDDQQMGRISSLEVNQDNFRKDVEELVDYIEKHSFNNMYLAVTVDKLINTLDRAGIIRRKVLENQIRHEMQGNLFGFEQRIRLEDRLHTITENYKGAHAETFSDLLNRAIPLLYTSKHRQSMRLLNKALVMSPQNTGLLQIMAEICYITGNYSDARRFLIRIRRKRRDSVPANLFLALVCLKKGQYQKAQDCLESIRETTHQTFTAYFLMGVVHFLQQDFKNSGLIFKQAYDFRPLPQVSLLGSMAFYLSRSFGKAWTFSRKVQSSYDKSGFFHFLSGLINRQRNWNRKAESHFKKAGRYNQKWKTVLHEIDEMEPEKSFQRQTRLFTSKLHREMEDLIGLLVSEIQNIEQ